MKKSFTTLRINKVMGSALKDVAVIICHDILGLRRVDEDTIMKAYRYSVDGNEEYEHCYFEIEKIVANSLKESAFGFIFADSDYLLSSMVADVVVILFDSI